MVPDGRNVLVTGVASGLASLTARGLEGHGQVGRIVGVDVAEPPVELERAVFVRTELDDEALVDVIDTYEVDTVLHLAPISASLRLDADERKERHVIGTMQLLATCQNAPGVRQVVLGSSTAVYGASSTDPALFREEATPPLPEHGFGKDMAEIEGYVRRFGRQRQDVDVSILRFAPLIGPRLDSPFDILFTLPVVPRVLGFDPRLQFCHEEDALEVLLHVLTGPTPGTTNVAGDGVVYLSQCLRLARQPSLPVPGAAASAVASLLRRGADVHIDPDQLRFLRYGRVVDTERLRTEVGYHPRYSSRAAFEDLARRRRSDRTVEPTRGGATA